MSRGRPLKDRSHYWHEDGMKILGKAAHEVISAYDYRHTNFVEAGDLISEGWIRSFRRGRDEDLRKTMLWAKKTMINAFFELRDEQVYKQHQLHPHSIHEIVKYFPLVYNQGQWGVRCIDLWDLIVHRVPGRHQLIIANDACGRGTRQSADDLGITQQAVRNLRRHIRPSVDEELARS
jgi:hypothetical protein